MDELKRALKDLLEQRKRLFEAEAKPLIDATQGRAMDADETAKSEAIEARFAQLDVAIRQMRGQIDTEEQRAALGLDGERRSQSGIADKLRSVVLERTEGSVELPFDTSMVTRALGSATTSDGAGNTIDSPLWGEFLVPLRDSSSIIEAGARVVVTASGETIQVPYLKTFGAAETGTAESATMAGTDPTFGLVDWATTKKDQIVYAPRELIEDSSIDIEALIGSLIGLNVGLKVGQAATTAVAAAVSAGVTGAATKFTPTFDEIVDLEHSVARLYRKGASFIANDTATKALRKIKDTTGQYIWQPAVQVGQPDMLNGKPYLTDAFLADPAAGVRPLLFGDFRLGVWVRIVGSLRIERSDQAAWAKDQIGFKGVVRTGQAVVDQNAVKAYVSGAAS
jgi:HK97 family phage major capsid protein